MSGVNRRSNGIAVQSLTSVRRQKKMGAAGPDSLLVIHHSKGPVKGEHCRLCHQFLEGRLDVATGRGERQ